MEPDQTCPLGSDPSVRLAQQKKRIALMLQSYGSLLEDLIEALETGTAPVATQLAKKLPELRYWLKQANEIEQETKDDINRAQSTKDSDTDLDQVRADIGCRLARLRRCCGADTVS